MKSNPARLKMLLRLRRVRLVEQKLARSELAEAQLAQSRMSELAFRSEKLAAEYTAGTQQCRADELIAMQQFRTHLGTLAKSAKDMEGQAATHVDRTMSQLALADRRMDQLTEHIGEEKSRKNAGALARAYIGPSKLARRLQSQTQETPPQPSGAKP